jgi:peptide/nickel transport system substrate-binding protein
MGRWLTNYRPLYSGVVALTLLLVLACSSAATPTPGPTVDQPPAAGTTAPAPTTTAPAATTLNPAAAASPMPTPQATVTPAPQQPETAKNNMIAVMGVEPPTLFSWPTIDAHPSQMTRSTQLWFGHMSRDTLELLPTNLIKSWKQIAPDRWEYELRPGVTFHDGEPWNAAAWQTYAEFAGVPDYGIRSYSGTGPYTVEDLGNNRVLIKCGSPCALFNQGMALSLTMSPKPLREIPFDEIRQSVGAGPYKFDEWIPGVKVRTSIFEDYVDIRDENPEFAYPIIQEIEWQWREEPSVRAAMISAGETDWAFLITLDDAENLGPDRFVTGGTAEVAQYRINRIWDPWLSKKEMRQAIVHSINCQEIVDSIYQGQTTCRGNFGAPGVLGITEENIKPHEYNPDLSRQLLEEIGYICNQPNSAPNCGAEIKITARPARIEQNTELVEAMVGYMQAVGINAAAVFVEPGVSTNIGACGMGTPGAKRAGWQGATESVPPPTCDPGQIHDGIGADWDLLDYGPFVQDRLMCQSSRGTVCVPEMEAEMERAVGLAGEERRKALEKIADWNREEVNFIHLFDLFAVYGINPKLRGFEEPRFDKRTFFNLMWFEE